VFVCVPKCSLIKLLLYILFEKYIYILTLEMANPGNQHCASCIGTLSFPIRDVTYVVNMFDEAVQRSRRAAALLTYRAGARACVCRHEVLVRRVRQVVLSAAEPRHPRQHAPRRPPCTAPRARLRHLPQEVRKYAHASLLQPAAACCCRRQTVYWILPAPKGWIKQTYRKIMRTQNRPTQNHITGNGLVQVE